MLGQPLKQGTSCPCLCPSHRGVLLMLLKFKERPDVCLWDAGVWSSPYSLCSWFLLLILLCSNFVVSETRGTFFWQVENLPLQGHLLLLPFLKKANICFMNRCDRRSGTLCLCDLKQDNNDFFFFHCNNENCTCVNWTRKERMRKPEWLYCSLMFLIVKTRMLCPNAVDFFS